MIRFECIVKIMDDIIHNQVYSKLGDICDDLHLSYQQVADISSNRKNKFESNKFKFAPRITIIKISS